MDNRASVTERERERARGAMKKSKRVGRECLSQYKSSEEFVLHENEFNCFGFDLYVRCKQIRFLIFIY